MTLDEMQKLAEQVQDDYWQQGPWMVAENCLKLIAVARAAQAVDVHAWNTCEFHGYAAGECTCGFKVMREALAALEG